MLSRRQFLKGGVSASLALVAPGICFAGQGSDTSRFILVILRGGMDGLAAVPAYADKHYYDVRGQLALPEPGKENGILDLNGLFGMHPGLVSMHKLYRSGELLVVQGTAPPYQKRSHFDAQNVLESGFPVPHAKKDGWLYRSLAAIDHGHGQRSLAMSVGPSVPLVLRGEHPVASWTPDNMPDPDDSTMSRLLALYRHDPILGPSVASMMETESMLDEMGEPMGGRGNLLRVLSTAAAQFLAHTDGPRIAVLESGGWDTHANQGSVNGILAARLRALDDIIGNLKTNLQKVWSTTAVLLVTEFGRTVAMNGTRGTDHGVGGVAFLLGGAVKGGQVISDWTGLDRKHLFEGRDLMPTIDQRSLFKAVLTDHMGAEPALVEETAFPDSRDVKPLRGLFKPQAGGRRALLTARAIKSNALV